MTENLDGDAIEHSSGVTPAEEPSAGVATQGSSAPPISVAQALIVAGVIAIVVSLFLNWLDLHVSVGAVSRSRTGNATWVPVQFLFDRHESGDDPSILLVLIPAAALGLLGAWTHQRVLAWIAGAVSLLVPSLYAYQVDRGLDEVNKAARGVVHLGLNDLIGIAPYVCGAGALVVLVGAFMLGRAPRRDDVPRDPGVPAAEEA